MNDNLEKHQFDLQFREKRISAVFKALCVVVPFASVAFVQLENESSAGLTNLFVLYTCVLAFLLPLTISMLLYIFKEASMFKLNDASLTQINAEEYYDDIFTCFLFSGFISLVLCVISCMLLHEIQNYNVILQILFVIGSIYTSVYIFIRSMHKNPYKILVFVCASVMIFSVFLLTGLHS